MRRPSVKLERRGVCFTLIIRENKFLICITAKVIRNKHMEQGKKVLTFDNLTRLFIDLH
jgi:ABC-type uncharacterized transport system YnjBCD permease subunit